ncbi:MAG: nucleoside hydrolase [Acidobacteria bacterium]|nr:nucleoside hydrolase [Acidobacteriota bacterium]MCI0626566.1 nucleoside hydrolase [Acidobacteriota bacterium]
MIWRKWLVAIGFSILLVEAITVYGLAQEGRMKVILDLDIGDDIDDAWALAFVISHKNFETLGITTAHGKTPARAKVACKMLHMTGRRNIPVFVGRQTEQKQYSHQYTWAEDFEALKPQKKSAADFIVETAKRYPGQVTLLAVGPLENVADALRKEPQLGKHLKRVVLMSGCIYGSARSPSVVAEYNVRAAIADAQTVYSAGLPLTIVPLDSTTLVRLSDEEREQLRKHDSPLTYALESLYRLWLSSPQSRMTLHDQLAVAETASPKRFFGKLETLPLVVDEKGFTRIDEKLGKPVTVCLEPKRDEFMGYYISELLQQRLGMEPRSISTR